MPLYEYRCNACNAEYEELVSIYESENPPCPTCGSKETYKKQSTFTNTGGGGSCYPYSGG